MDINEFNSVTTSPTLSHSQWVRTTAEFLGDAGVLLTSTFLMVLVNNEFSVPLVEHNLVVFHSNMLNFFTSLFLSLPFSRQCRYFHFIQHGPMPTPVI